MEHNITHRSNNGTVSFSEVMITLIAEKDCSDNRFSLSVEFPE